MPSSDSNGNEAVLVMAPIGNDAELVAEFLQRAGLSCVPCARAEELREGIDGGAGVVLVTEEVLASGAREVLARALEAQPHWSDIPVIVLSASDSRFGGSEAISELAGTGRYVNILERPLGHESLLAAVRSALKARARQFQVAHLLGRLENMNRELERRVVERTTELQSTNQVLIREVEQKKTAQEALSADISERKRVEEELRKTRDELEINVRRRTEELLRANAVLQEKASLLDLAHDPILVRDPNDVIIYWNLGAARRYGWQKEEVIGKSVHDTMQTVFPQPLEEIRARLFEEGYWEGELRYTSRDGESILVNSSWVLEKDSQGNAVKILESNRDITQRKRMEAELRSARDKLEERVGERTAQLTRTNQALQVEIAERKRAEDALNDAKRELEKRVHERTLELKEKSESLEEVNTALKVLLKQRDEDRKEFGESILANVRNLIVPYIERLQKSQLSSTQMTLVGILEAHINELTSSFSRRLGLQHANLTPTEMRIAALIRDGKSTGDIAEILCISEKTVLCHRDGIRQKLGLRGGRANLRSHLLNVT